MTWRVAIRYIHAGLVCTSAFSLLIAASGCGPTEPTPQTRKSVPFERSDEAPDPTTGFVLEAYGIGASWYAYDGSSHVLSPHPEWYRIDRGNESFAVHVEDYYDERGTSGYFTLKVRHKEDSQWSTPRDIDATSNVKETDVCVDLAGAREVSCTSDKWQLILRTDKRIVPAAGFAVSNPAIYVRGHYVTFPDNPPTVTAVEGEDVSSSPLRDEGVELPSSRLDLNDSAIGPLRDRDGTRRVRGPLLQATADMKLVRWRIRQVSVSSDTTAVALQSSCAPLAETRESQQLPANSNTRESRVVIPSRGEYGLALVELCDEGPTQIVERTEPFDGRWPNTETFDLVVERWHSRLVVRLPPGHLVWKPSTALSKPGDVTSASNMPGNLWGR